MSLRYEMMLSEVPPVMAAHTTASQGTPTCRFEAALRALVEDVLLLGPLIYLDN